MTWPIALGGWQSAGTPNAGASRHPAVSVAALVAVLLVVPTAGCSDADASPSTTTTMPSTTTAVPSDDLPELLIAVRDEPDPPPLASRSRLVEVDLDVLFGENGKPRNLVEFELTLFDDATYVAVIDQVSEEGGGTTWSGHLDGIGLSYFTMVYTASTFIGHFASPEGVFEVRFVEGKRYRVTQVDPSQMPTEG